MTDLDLKLAEAWLYGCDWRTEAGRGVVLGAWLRNAAVRARRVGDALYPWDWRVADALYPWDIWGGGRVSHPARFARESEKGSCFTQGSERGYPGVGQRMPGGNFVTSLGSGRSGKYRGERLLQLLSGKNEWKT